MYFSKLCIFQNYAFFRKHVFFQNRAFFQKSHIFSKKRIFSKLACMTSQGPYRAKNSLEIRRPYGSLRNNHPTSNSRNVSPRRFFADRVPFNPILKLIR